MDVEHRRVLVAIALMGNISQQPYAILEEIATSWGTLTKYKKLPTYLEHLKQSGLILLNGNATFGHYGEHALIHQVPSCISAATAFGHGRQQPRSTRGRRLAANY